MRYSVIKIKIFNKIINLLRNSIDKISFESILNKSFKKGDEFRIIQVGAHDGVKHDFLSNFLIERDSKGILIEPINDYYNSLVQNFSKFPNLIKLKIALHCNLKESIIYKVDPVYEMNLPDWAPGSASFDKNNLIKQKINQDYIIEEKVSCSTFMDIYNKNYCFEKVDLIQIDVEGYDFEVIKMIDFDIVKAKIVKFEHRNLSSADYQSALELFSSANYLVVMEGQDSIAYRMSSNIIKLSNFFK